MATFSNVNDLIYFLYQFLGKQILIIKKNNQTKHIPFGWLWSKKSVSPEPVKAEFISLTIPAKIIRKKRIKL